MRRSQRTLKPDDEDDPLGHPHRQALMYADCVSCCPLVSHDEYADGRDRQRDGRRTPDRYITLSPRRGQLNKNAEYKHGYWSCVYNIINKVSP